MIGREKELAILNKLYNSKKFEFLIMYGRRRIGKTTILSEFAKTVNAIFYSAQEKNDALNLESFSKLVQIKLNGSYISSFKTWSEAFDYIYENNKKKLAIIIDEFPYLAEANPTIKSMLQHTIDHKWNDTNIFLIICGSSVSFMEKEILGSKSPLYGRQTSKIEIKPFDYFESKYFFNKYSNDEKILTYGILGGVPKYLSTFKDKETIEKNIADNIVSSDGILYEEPSTLLRSELREPAVYNSILEAIANGKNKISEISSCTHEDKSKISKYIITLQSMRLVEKRVPCGENINSKKGLYVINDNFFKFWYKYRFTNNQHFDIIGAEETAKEICNNINEFMGQIFEDICRQYFINLAKKKKLPLEPYYIGKWWGQNQFLKAQDDVDLLIMNKDKTSGIFVECKYTSKPMKYEEYEDLINATKAFPYIKKKYLYFISKSKYTNPVIKQAKIDGSKLLSIDDLYKY